MYFRCWQKGCRAALRTNVFAYNRQHPNPIIQIFHNDEHEHNREDDQIRQREIINDMKDQLRAEPTTPVKRIYNQTVANAHQNAGAAGVAATAIPDFSYVMSSLNRVKASTCPPIPHDINQGQINGTFAQTFLGERYLFHLDNAIGVAILATDFELRQIANSATIYVDETFKTAPVPYRQIFTIHCEFLDRVIPLAVGLLTGKTPTTLRYCDKLNFAGMSPVDREQHNSKCSSLWLLLPLRTKSLEACAGSWAKGCLW